MARYRIVIDLEASSVSMKWIRRAIRTAISAYTLDYSIQDSDYLTQKEILDRLCDSLHS